MVEDARQIWVTTRDRDGKIVWDSRRLPPFSGRGKPAAIMPENLELGQPRLLCRDHRQVQQQPRIQGIVLGQVFQW